MKIFVHTAYSFCSFARLMTIVVVVVTEFFAPSVPFMDSDGMKPEKKLKLEWVYP